MRLSGALLYDLKFQFRHGFYYAYGFVCLLYLALLSFLPPSVKEDVLTLAVFTDTSVLGFFFVGGILLLERSQGVHAWLGVTPLSVGEMIFSKTLSLSLLAFLASSLLYAGSLQIPGRIFLPASGILTGSIFFTLIGISLASMVRTVNGFFLLSLPLSVIIIPAILTYFELVPPALSLLFPSSGALILLAAGFKNFPPHLIGFAYLSSLLWISAAWLITRRRMERYLAATGGGIR